MVCKESVVHNSRYTPGICWRDWAKQRKLTIAIASFQAKHEPGTTGIRNRSANHLVATDAWCGYWTKYMENILCPLYSGATSKFIGWCVALSGLVVIVLIIGPKVHEFKPSRGRRIFKGDKNPQHVFHRREVKSWAPCRKVLRHAKGLCGAWQRYYAGKINGHFSPSFSLHRD
jgi:hypothetical protein